MPNHTEELLQIEVGILLTRCDELEQDILERRFGFYGPVMTRSEISKELDVPVSLIISNETKALRRLVPFARKIHTLFEESE